METSSQQSQPSQQPSKETMEVGKKLVELCKRGDNMKAIDWLYSENIESKEAASMPGMPAQMRGIEAIRKKNMEWDEQMEVHSMDVSGPYPHGDRFAVHYKLDVSERKSGKRWQMEEVALYTVSNGKIVKEEFFYTM
ncbi:SnoaL-like domain-containing protein [Bdellovibrio sp. HCB117]|nr:nuclear transport factor 2 family protein [Bdellovibrio bacteriovorus]